MITVLIFVLLFIAVFCIYFTAFKKTFIRGPFSRFGTKTLLAENKSEHWDNLKEKGRLWREDADFTTVSIKSHDNLTLVADLYKNPDAKGVFILFHGYRSNPVKDFDCILQKYYDLGYSLLVPDQRAHGRSEGKYITFGILERFDCKGWVKYITERYGADTPIYLDGLSMGATTVLMGAPLISFANVRGIIADSAFTSPRDIIEKVGHTDLKLPYFLFMPELKLLCRLFARFDLDATSTFDSLKSSRIPILFIHGKADELVPFEMVEKHSSKNGEIYTVVSVDNATHGFSYIVDTPLVEKALMNFIEKTQK